MVGVTVRNMNNIGVVIKADDFSEVFLTDSNISDNDIPAAGWKAIEALSNAFVSVSSTTLERNTGVQFVASARNMSTITLELVRIIDTTAVEAPVSVSIMF
jgi:hypothetical protein